MPPPTELAPPVVAADETVVIKKTTRISNININRGDAIIFSTEVSSVDKTSGVDRVITPGKQVVRQFTDVILATRVGGTGATLAATIGKLGDFYAQFRAEDVAAQNP